MFSFGRERVVEDDESRAAIALTAELDAVAAWAGKKKIECRGCVRTWHVILHVPLTPETTFLHRIFDEVTVSRF